MSGVALIIPTLAIIAVSALIVKIATISLTMTGMDKKRARFQALSAFTGTGFTTKDAESVVKHEQRRRIIMVLMILGNAGLVSIIATLIGSFAKIKRVSQVPANLMLLAAGIYLIYWLASRRGLMRRWGKWIEKRIAQSMALEEKGIEEVLHLAEGYGIAEVKIKDDSAVVNQPLANSALSQKDILVLAIERGGGIIPTPKGNDGIRAADNLICYGKLANIRKII
ncbi:MAG: potassium transporter TrkA [Nitrospirae bacterium]|nr:potassium transporter TrkA [Nitrospirota bacterium]